MITLNEETSLARLNKCIHQPNTKEYSLEEQLDSVSTDEYLDGMSDTAKAIFEEVKLDEQPITNNEPKIEINVEDTGIDIPLNEPDKESTENNEELFNNNTKQKVPRKKREKTDTNTNLDDLVICKSLNPILDQLSKDLIDELMSKHYKLNRFNEESMNMLFKYMYSKF